MDEPGLSLFRCICGRGIWALPSADIRCRCGGRMKGECIEPRRRRENARARAVMRETAVL
jgi:hypothetical protein